MFVGPGIDDLRLQLTSPCIDAGSDPAVPGDKADVDGDGDQLEQTPLDFAFRRRFAHDTAASGASICEAGPVNMGAFESGDCSNPPDGVPDDQEIDADGDGIPDECLDCQATLDCDSDGIPDDCEIAGMCSIDKDGDGVPDECNCDPDIVDIVFIVDTSGSQEDLASICSMANQVISQLSVFSGCIDVRAEYFGITVTPSCAGFPGVPNNVAATVGTVVPGDGGACGQSLIGQPGSDENWGPATAIVAAGYPWRAFARRIIVPISDEAPCRGGPSIGDPCETSPGSADLDSIENAIVQADLNVVFVFPITGSMTYLGADPACVRYLAGLLGVGTEGATIDLEAEGNSWDEVGSKLLDGIVSLVNQCVDTCPDLTGDCVVDTVDFLLLLQNWTHPGPPCTGCVDCLGDLNGDLAIDTVDFLALLQRWGLCPDCEPLGGAGGDDVPGNADLITALNLLGFDDLVQFNSWALSAEEGQVAIVAHALAAVLMVDRQ